VNNYARELASNGPYQLVGAFRNNTLDYETFYVRGDDNQLSGLSKRSVSKNPKEGDLFDISRRIQPGGKERQLNVILISIESLSAEFLTRFGNGEHITPFMDGLQKESLFFTRHFATGTRTDRGLEAITLSIPPTPGRSLVKRPDNEHIYNLGFEFKNRGYDIAFLYGGRGYFDNMNAFFSGNGYRIVDQTALKSSEITFKNAWGVSDEDLYRKTLREADAAYGRGSHFFYHVMTTSNHRPFTYPEGKVDIPSGTGRSGAVKYTDYALQEFIASAKKQKWFDDTVFVVVADHCAGSAGEVGLPVRKYHIPLFIYSPKNIEPREIAKTSSQIDIAPTLLALLGFNYDSHFWGNDILREDFTERALIGNYQKLGLYKDEKLVILSPRKKIDVMEKPLTQNQIASGTTADPLSLEAMAYYQGADFILKHRMNRWEYAGRVNPVVARASH
jgi:phosphoglycerol transferase MdoB-like AlkP superfamily enzyme